SSGLPTKLGRVGVLTLRDLVAYTNLYGFRWHRRGSGLGVVRAQRLTQWLAPVAEGAGGRLAAARRSSEAGSPARTPGARPPAPLLCPAGGVRAGQRIQTFGPPKPTSG